MKILTVLGARPQFIKASTVSRALAKAGAKEVIVHTGQHFDHNMSQVFFDEMEISPPDYQLGIHGLNHGALTGRMLEKTEEVLLLEKPDYVLVYGDTNSTLAGALAASKLHYPVAHIEAGLRSFTMVMPEEINRVITDRISSVLFCPTQTAIQNLRDEGFAKMNRKIILSGDVMYDAVLFYREKARTHSTIVEKLNPGNKEFVLATIHRAENTDDPDRLRQIVLALNEIHREVPVILPLHPRTRDYIKSRHIDLHVTCIDPVGYFDMLALLDGCSLVLTDSGGLQKEAYFFEKYCITLRDQTEWIELLAAGANFLAGADAKKITGTFRKYFGKPMKKNGLLYGNGNASGIIARELTQIKS